LTELEFDRPKKSEHCASAFSFSDFFGMFSCLKKSRGAGQSPVWIAAIIFIIFRETPFVRFYSQAFASLIISPFETRKIRHFEVKRIFLKNKKMLKEIFSKGKMATK